MSRLNVRRRGDAVRSQRIFILWWNITVDVEPGAGGDTPHSIGRLAPVQPTITREHRGDVQMTHHQPVTSQVLTNQHPANWTVLAVIGRQQQHDF